MSLILFILRCNRRSDDTISRARAHTLKKIKKKKEERSRKKWRKENLHKYKGKKNERDDDND
jgi:hypothetical protein